MTESSNRDRRGRFLSGHQLGGRPPGCPNGGRTQQPPTPAHDDQAAHVAVADQPPAAPRPRGRFRIVIPSIED